MNLADVRSLLKERNVNLSVHDDQLVVRAPPGAVDGELLDLLKRYKAELLAAPSHPDDGGDAPDGFPLSGLGSEDIAAITATTSGGAANLQDIYRLVPLQEGMLFHHMVATDSDPYVQRMVFVFSDRRHLDAFLSALNHVISRHDILRTAIRWEGLAHPVQVVHREAPLVVESLPPGEVGTAMERLLSASDPRRKRLDLQQAPMLLAMLAAEPEGGDLVLALMHHHIGCDHVTQSLIIKEVMAILLGHADGLPRPRQFRESVIKALATTESEHRDYFVNQLGALSEPSAPFGVLDVRTDGADVVEQRTALEPVLATQVRSAAREAGVTPATLLHSAWGLVVARLSGQAQVAFGTVLSGRFHDAHSQQPVAGVLINTLPLCTAPGDLSVVDYVAETHRRLMGLLAHEHAPLALALRCSGLPASLPLFTTLLNYRQAASEHADAGHEGAGMALEGIQLIHGEERSNYPITLLVDDHGSQGFTLTAQCVEGVDAGLVLACLVTAIEGLALALRGSPTLRADAVSILPAAQRDQLVHGFNATQAEYPREGLIGACFTAQAQARPGAVAVVEGDERLSYAELECAANQLAHRLVGMGAGPGQRVALCMERGIALVVSMLAVVKAGGAYVPLEPTAPAARLAWQLEDCAPVALLTQDALVDDLPAQSLLPVVVVDDPQEVRQTAAQPRHAPVVEGLGARDLAYVIYTSGSTGQPKGVMVEHRNVLRLVINSGFAPLGVDDCVAHCASPAFDAATWEIWGALLNGARLQIVSAAQVRDPAQLGTALQAGGVTALWLTAGLFNEVVDALEDALGGLRYLLIGGEALDAVAVGRLVNRPVRPQQVLNGYGPTESTTFATTYLIPPVAPGQRSIPIGRPIGNTRIHVLDTAGQVVPVGVVGQLHIGGDGVARGYLNRPELTAERFIADPFSADPQARLYRTGDLARWRADGTLDYVGRNDFQVKIRGFRIELGEIEAQLLACADVREAVVLAREDSPGDKRLVAYVLAEEGTSPEAATLRAALARKLPEYMVPVAFVRVSGWPLTVNGKLDRRALPPPDGESVAAQAYEAPANEREAQVAGLWADLLGVAQVGRHDHFFELGGHSLLAIQLVSALRRTLGREVPLGRLFEHPTLAGFAATLDDSTHSTLGSVVPADRSAALPLSWAQQRLWFLDQLDPAAGLAYHIPAALRLQGTLDVAALQATLDRIVARHESLRTCFVQGEDGPVQQFAPETIGFALEQVDLSALSHDAQQAVVEQRSAQEALAPFDLAVGPLIRGQLLRLSAQEHVLLVTQHHIVSDGWSIGVMIGEVTALYEAFSQGQPDPLPPLAIQYADYALWQRQWLQGEALQQQLGFWREHLSGAPALLELPTDRPRPAVQSYAGGNVAFTLPAPLVERLHALSQRHGTTLFMTLLSGWALLMSRLSGQGEVVIGTPVANRQRAEIEPLIGFFVNTLALRVNVQAASDVAGLLAQVKATALAGYAHQDVPFEQVVEALQPARSMGHTPVIQVMLALNNTPDAGGSPLSGLELSALETPRTTTHFDLSLSMTETPNGLECSLEYASDLFDAITVQRWAKHLAVLLGALADHEEMPLAEVSLLSAPERHQLLHEFNATRVAYPENGLIGDCFSTQAQAQPDAVALSEGSAHMTYAELERRANQLAHRLIGMGVRPDDRVALCMERSIDLVVSMLAVLKAGGAYVPLEPSAPVARLAWQLDDCAPVILLSHRGLHRDLAVPRLYVDEPAQTSITAAESEHAPHIAGLVSRHLAYVIYTSGSTGQPKGVMVEHRNVLRLVINSDYAPLGSDDCVAHCASPAFDAATWEIWGALLNGARVQVVTSAEMRDPAAFSAVLSSGGVTAMMLTTGLFNQLVDELEPVLGGLRHLLTGGEAMDPVIAGRLVNRQVRPQRVLNVYGPTEATAYATAYEIVSVAPGQRSIPIGRPISNTRVHVLDTAGQLVPLGVSGELHIGGDGVARGYLNRPELTAERFIADPFAGDPDARLYRTGDLVRWRTDGTLEYLGRNDFQVKIRGFRIELGEIEARLGACMGVREAVVLAREEAPGVKRLVAYVLADEGVVLSVAELRQRLAYALPEYMVPSAYVLMAAWPLNVNGKLDRRALPAPGDDAVVAEAYTAPANDLEARVARIWTALLGVSRVGRHDDFFVLGGHSLLAIQLVSALRRDLGIEAELGALFRHSTLSGFSTSLAGSAGSRLGELLPVERTGALPLSWAQQRLWFLDQLDPAAGLAYHIPAALRLQGTLDVAALQATLDRIVARHESLRTCFVQGEDGPVQQFAPETIGFALEQVDLSALSHDAQQAVVEQRSAQEALAPFDLAVGPLIRGQLLRLSAQEHVLLVTQHHIVSDGWSIGVMIGEVTALYEAFSQGQPDPLPPLAIQYADYALWQRQWLQGEALQQQLGFWREHLSGAPALLELPTDRPRPAVQSYAGGNVAFTLPAPLVERLHALSQRHGTTLFMTLLSGWALLMSRLSGQGEVVIGTPVANRQRAEIEPLIGFFVNTLALRVNVQAASDVAGLLAQVKATALAGYAHQDVPFEQVVEALQPARSMGHTPVIQVMLALNNTPDAGGSPLSGLELSALETPRTTTHFDLSLSMTETPNSLECGLEYASDLFDAITVQRWAKHLAVLLGALADHEEMPLAEVSLLSAPERHQLLHEFNATRVAYPENGLIGDCFSTQAQAQPDAVALSEGSAHMTYAELERRANQLAHRLIGMGVRPDDRVALCMERSIDLVVSMLAVLKAGGAYVPLEPSAPVARLAWQLDDCAPVILLSHRGLHRDLAVPRLYVDEPAQTSITAAESEHAPHIAGLVSRHLAYVIYTSGSTGQPKGVMVEHRSVLRLVINSGFAPLGVDDCVAHCASPAFDAATWEIWGALLNGARLQIVSAAQVRDPAQLGTALQAGGVTALWLTAGLFNEVVDALEDALGGLRYLLIGGEALDAVAVGRLVNRPVRPQQVLNGYGPTESTTFATTYLIPPVAPGQRSIPIGRPIGNTRIHVLDTAGQVVPVGVVGQLHIGGDGVARGYLNRPELTAERFIADPFSADPQARLYRTGDLARWRADGTLDYVGRNDFQVKIRGFRIELGEIEAQLLACAGIREAVVVAREERAGDRRLVAYLIAEDGAEPVPAVLRDALARKLPEYMLPSAFVVLAAWPLTANGKLDRAALPAADAAAVATRGHEAPVSEIEVQVAGIWAELLGLERVGRQDNFFALGGHSLLATQVVSAVRRLLGWEVPLGQVFRHPTLAAFAACVEESAPSTLEALVPTVRPEVLPLSWAQQRLWFLDQLDPAASAAYHMPAALRLQGALDRVALQAALDRVVARHEGLRARFVSGKDGPVQQFAPDSIGFALQYRDLGDLAPAAQAEAVAEADRRQTQSPFDLTTGPLIRGQLLRLSAQEHVLLVTQHHIVSDGWSIGVMIGEVTALYEAFSQGQPDPLPPLAIQYADYALWQRQWLQGEALQQQLGFWREHLSGAPALLELPTDRPRPAVQSYAGGNVAFTLPAPLVERLHALSQRHGTTLFMTLLSGWALLMSRLSGQGEVVIGTPVANRQRAEIEPLIGFFVNTLALRVNVQAASDVAGLLAQVKATALAGYTHQELAFEQVVEALQPTRSLGHSPVFQTMVSLNNTPVRGATEVPGLVLSPLESQQTTTQFDLSLSLIEADEVLEGGLEYASDLFDAATVQRWCAHLVKVLEAMVADDRQAVAAVPLLADFARDQLVRAFNQTASAPVEAATVQALFERQVQQAPSAVAVIHEDRAVSYAELNRQSNQLAHQLIGLGVGPEHRVALCMERGVDMVVGLLGILKAGAGYVPLDPAYPRERLAYIVQDSAPTAVLSHIGLPAAVHDWLQTVAPAQVVLGDAATMERLGALPEHDPAVTSDAHDLAYVIHTSGSTGRPKGVLVEHHSMVNLVAEHVRRCGLGRDDRVLQFASMSFDASVEEIFAPLAAGATLVLRPSLLPPDSTFSQYLRDQRISVVELPTAFWHYWVGDAGFEHGLAQTCARLVVIGGEKASADSVARWHHACARHPCQLLNTYGPTEATVYATATLLEPACRATGEPSIGRPIANTQVHVLDAWQQVQPLGVVGEIHIGGAGVARGYLNQPALTAERFIADPFSTDPQARLYRTGDLGRWRADGTLEYVGRNDFQVKLRGFRIELGEIESRLRACAGVREAVVLAREDRPGDPRLVAYVQADTGAMPASAALREALSGALPDYMVPGAYVTVDAWPVNASGKLDRRALPAPDAAAVSTQAYEAPATATEARVAEVWSALLGVARIGRHDHFFELGGHSLLATQLVATLRRTIGREVPLRRVFEQPTLSGFCTALAGSAGSKLGELLPVERTGALPLSWAQQRLWFLDQLDPAASLAYHMPTALRLEGPLDGAALQATLDRIVARHESLRTYFVQTVNGPVQQFAPDTVGFALTHADLSGLTVDMQQAMVVQRSAQEARAPFDLARGPLIRGQLLRLSANEHVLLVTQHHIVSDGWSIGVMIGEVSRLYAAFSQGQPDPLALLPIQYADYAMWQRQWLQGETLQQQIGFWREHLSGAPALLELPTDHPRPAVQSYAGGSIAFDLPASLVNGLRALSQQHGTTLFMTVLAAWATLLSRLSGQDEVVIGTPVANRQRAEIEPLIGFFVNTLALRVNVQGAADVAGLLAQVKATALAAYAHQDLPFEQVVEALQPTRSLGHGPVFQVLLTLNNTPEAEAEDLPGLTLSSLPAPHTTTQFDLSLSLGAKGDALTCTLEYASDLFEAATVQRWTEHLATLLEAMVAEPKLPLVQMPLLTTSQREQLLLDFNATDACVADAGRVAARFSAQAQARPDAVAVVHGTDVLRFGELERRSNQLAHHLLALGVAPDDRVAVCLERGINLMVALLGVLKAGAAYVPLDPAAPAARVAWQLEDAAPRVVLTRQALAPGLPMPCLALDDPDQQRALSQQPAQVPQVPALQPRHLAYVIYTSGSTGQPKGVMVEHRQLEHYLHWAQHAYAGDTRIDALVSSPFAFDATITSLYLPLITGGSVQLVPEGTELAALPQLLLDSPAGTLCKITPSHLVVLCEQLAQTGRVCPPHLFVVGGEALPSSTAATLQALAPGARIINEYGPTETTVGCAMQVADGMCQADGAVPIGRPIANTRLYVLDREGQLVPQGVVGEIHIGGGGVARGYLNRPGLTAERFIADPFSTDPQARLYRSGDLGRWRADGTLEYLGRNDQQVKIRGFRIELGEIEAQLVACAGIREAVVVAAMEPGGDRRLVAYLIAEDGAEPVPAVLRDALARKLPEYMLPSAFVVLAAWPLTANGKLDRAALPAADAAAVATRGHEAPVSEIEVQVAGIWAELLGLERVGRQDNFFEVGGHSLIVVMMVDRLRGQGLNVEIRSVFLTPTVAGLAATIAGQTDTASSNARSETVRVESIAMTHDTTDKELELTELRNGQAAAVPAGHTLANTDAEHRYQPLVTIQGGASGARPIYCVPGAGASVTGFCQLAMALGSEIPLIGLQPRGLDSLLAPYPDVEAAAESYVRAIIASQPDGPCDVLGHSFGGWVALEVARKLEAAGREVTSLFILDSSPPSATPRSSNRLEALLHLVELYDMNLDLPLGLSADDFNVVDATGQLELLLSRLIARGVLPPRTPIQVLTGVVRVFEANVNSRYLPQRPLTRAVELVGVEEDASADDAEAGFPAWRCHTPQARLWRAPGNHITLLSGKNVTELAAWMRARRNDTGIESEIPSTTKVKREFWT